MSLYIKKIQDKKENVIVIDVEAVDDFFYAFYSIFRALSQPMGGLLTPLIKPILSNLEEYKRTFLKYGKLSFDYEGKTYHIVLRRTK
jgi:hypothetical protein